MNKPFKDKICPNCGKVFRVRACEGSHILSEHMRYCNVYKISWRDPR